LQCEAEINKILPQQLSKYFFFDGERIEKMSKEIKNGKKSSEFADAVKGLLGLNAIISVIDHLNPKTKNGVIGSYENSYDSTSDANIEKYTKEIATYQTELDGIEKRLEEIDVETDKASDRKNDVNEKIKQYAEGERLQKQRDSLVKKIATARSSKKNTLDSMLRDFNNNMSTFFAKSMIKHALEELSTGDFIGKDIPEMHAKTIDFLLKKGKCICGTHLAEGNAAYNKVKELFEYLPPQSIGISVGQFVEESRLRAKSDELFSNISNSCAVLSEQEDNINEFLEEIILVEKKFTDGDISAKVSALHKEYQICEKIISDMKKETIGKIERRGSLTTLKERKITERAELSLRDESNRKIEIYKAYAQCIYDELNKVYIKSEQEIRNKLEQTINDIFKSIYNGGMSLTIDEKYAISVIVDDFDGFEVNVETSTAQSISVIFAFIAGIIKMARDNQNATNEEAKILVSEPYPLVMDAPLSAFDKRRIKNICEALPSIAEQVIIFIKDTDGELAEENIGGKVGSRYKFDKINEFETKLV